MIRRLFILLMLMTVVSGCGPSAKEKYDAAVAELDKAQAQLDALRPEYGLARQAAINDVCREIAGVTPDESATTALQGLGDIQNLAGAAIDPSKLDPAKAAEDASKKPATGRKGDDLDKLVDSAAALDAAQKQLAASTAPIAKAQETMKKINTPGTPEAKKLEEKLASMPAAKAYERQQKRVERAQQLVDELEKQLPGGDTSSEKK